MMQTSVWKKIKQKIRRKMKRYGSLAWHATMLSALIASLGWGFVITPLTLDAAEYEPIQQEDVSAWFSYDQKLRAIVHRIYVCGEEIVELDKLSYEDVVMLANQNPQWRLTVDQAHSLIRFEEQLNDLSPHCKGNAFFGIDDEGLFSLYDGMPAEEKVMKTFFQLNLPYLESRLPKGEFEHLQLGIRVRDIEEYDSVLATFNEFRLDRISQ
jgi:forespore regulator of the sigma-K checkpoint